MPYARADWSEWVLCDEAYRRAGGRRHYNAWRTTMALYRRYRLVNIAANARLNMFTRGSQVVLARALGVSPATTSRDVKRILDDCRPGKPCPVCGCKERHFWRRLEQREGSNGTATEPA
jgi:hypothetical protein